MQPEDIAKYITHIFSIENSLPGATLLKGEWGVGKTWFIKGLLKELNASQGVLLGQGQRSASKAIIYVRLFGVSTVDDLYASVARSYKLATGEEIEPRTTCQLRIVFDDFERCKLPVDELMACINDYIEHLDSRVLLIAHDSQIGVASGNGDRAKYDTMKEKVIWRTILFEQDIHKIYSSIRSRMTDAHELIERYDSDIFQAYIRSGFKNLRVVQQGLLELNYILKQLCSGELQRYFEHEKFAKHFVPLVISMIAEHRQNPEFKPGELTHEHDFVRAVMNRYPKNTIFNDFNEVNDKFLAKHGISSYGLILSNISWRSILEDGIVDISLIKSEIQKSMFFANEEHDDWVALWHYREMTDQSEFDKTYSVVYSRWKEYEYKNPPVMLHIVGILLDLIENNVIELDLKDIEEWMSRLSGDDNIKIERWHRDSSSYEREAAFGLGYSSRAHSIFQRCYELLVEIDTRSERRSAKELATRSKSDVSKLNEVRNTFGNWSDESKHAFIMSLDASDLVKIICVLPLKDMEGIIYMITRRTDSLQQHSEDIRLSIQFTDEVKVVRDIYNAIVLQISNSSDRIVKVKLGSLEKSLGKLLTKWDTSKLQL